MFKPVIKPINNAVIRLPYFQCNLFHRKPRWVAVIRLPYFQCNLFHRKPRWVPQAKSKIFRIFQKPKQDEDERAELMRLNPIYRTQVRSLRAYLAVEVKLRKTSSSADNIILTPEEKEAEFNQSVELNNAWNASIAEIRNQRLEIKMKQRKEAILSELELRRQRDEEEFRAAEELVRLEKLCFVIKSITERSKTFISIDNLDEAIEYALANPVDYNFAITLEG